MAMGLGFFFLTCDRKVQHTEIKVTLAVAPPSLCCTPAPPRYVELLTLSNLLCLRCPILIRLGLIPLYAFFSFFLRSLFSALPGTSRTSPPPSHPPPCSSIFPSRSVPSSRTSPAGPWLWRLSSLQCGSTLLLWLSRRKSVWWRKLYVAYARTWCKPLFFLIS